MNEKPEQDFSRVVEVLCRNESGRILATLIRLLGDPDLAEEALYDAFKAALEQWPDDSIRKNGHCLASEALQSVHTATMVRMHEGKPGITDGLFAETKEQSAD